MFSTRYLVLALALLLNLTGFAECKGRVDVGPAFVNIDVLESGKTQKSLDLWAFRGDATILLHKGFCIKPSVTIADGKHASFNTASLGMGFCIPVHADLVITPYIGISETSFKTHVNVEPLGLFHLRERFISQGGYAAMDITWGFAEGWRICGIYQYTWSYVKTKIELFPKFRDHCCGPNYALVLERDINESFSANIAIGYNVSLSKEKHGLRGKGIKFGLAYWF